MPSLTDADIARLKALKNYREKEFSSNTYECQECGSVHGSTLGAHTCCKNANDEV